MTLNHFVYTNCQFVGDVNDKSDKWHRQKGAKEHRLLIVYSTTTAVVVVITLVITSCVRNMTQRIGMYARMMARESAEWRRERRRSERLKYHLLPPGVATAIKTEGTHPAEAYDCVTVCVCDVINFHDTTARCTPTQVVDMLNQLHR